jgi:hypothetical protein
MCSDCYTPLLQHGWKLAPQGEVLCAAWPRHRARIESVRQMLFTAAERNRAKNEPPPPPKPQPLAVIKSGLPIAEVIAQLSELQKQYPDARVRRGDRNRWELWPADSTVNGPTRR